MDQTALLQTVGALPKNLGRLSIERDVRHVASVIMNVFDEYDVPVEAQQKIATTLRPALGSAR